VSEEEVETPGWSAIDSALTPVYGDGEPPFHYGTVYPHSLGGPDPIDGISVYRSNAFADHWHFVTYGFSELYAKENDDPDVSGFGFELTFRVARGGEESPPPWAINFLQNLGRYVFKSGNRFSIGDHMNANSPLKADETTSAIRAFICVPDPQLPESIDTPNGRVDFVQVFGITLNELEAVKRWSSTSFAELAAQHVPGLVTSLDRKSLLNDRAFAAAVEAGIARDGSTTGVIYGSKVDWKIDRGLFRKPSLVITLSATAAAELVAILPGRIGHGREFILGGEEKGITFTPGDAMSHAHDDSLLTLTITAAQATRIAETVKPLRGKYEVDGIRFVIEPSAIRDQDGTIREWVG